MPDNQALAKHTQLALATLLKKYAEKPVLKGAWYNNQRFQIDGYKFVECRFDNCILDVSSGEF